MLRAVLFDLDGVLVDSRDPIAASINHALHREGLAVAPREQLHRFIGPPLHETFELLLGERGAPLERAAVCVEHYREHYRVIAPRDTPAFPGVEACLAALAAHYRLVVATSKPEAFARPILQSLGLDRFFHAIVGPPLSATHAETKTQTVGRAMKSLGDAASAEEIAMVGDRHFDILAGRTHGLHTIGVRWGIGSDHELHTAGAHELVATPEALSVALLERG